jgi:hypothetical protein
MTLGTENVLTLCSPCLMSGRETQATKVRNGIRYCEECLSTIGQALGAEKPKGGVKMDVAKMSQADWDVVRERVDKGEKMSQVAKGLGMSYYQIMKGLGRIGAKTPGKGAKVTGVAKVRTSPSKVTKVKVAKVTQLPGLEALKADLQRRLAAVEVVIGLLREL